MTTYSNIAAYTYGGYLTGFPDSIEDLLPQNTSSIFGQNSLSDILARNYGMDSFTIIGKFTKVYYGIPSSYAANNVPGQQDFVVFTQSDIATGDPGSGHPTMRELSDGYNVLYSGHANDLSNLRVVNPDYPGLFDDPDTQLRNVVGGVFVTLHFFQPYVGPAIPTSGGGSSAYHAPVLRFNQRDDGHGSTAGHARLISSQPNGAQSGQARTAPRLNAGNVYDPGLSDHDGGI